MERTIALWVAYDGTDFHGWQDQPGFRTVQDSMQQVLRRVMRHPLGLVGSGRTDAGVHAAAHVSSFSTTSELDCEKMRLAVGSRLPEDLALIDLREVHRDFHATRSALGKLYRYRIHNAAIRPAASQTQRYTHHFWEPLDVDLMRQGAAHFVGTRDFIAMAGKGAPRVTTIRTIFRCDVERCGDEIRIDVEGDGFLYKQVRTMVGTLMNVGRGHWAPDRVAAILASRDRHQAGPTAPARGLCLQWVAYPKELLTPNAEMTNAECGMRNEGNEKRPCIS